MYTGSPIAPTIRQSFSPRDGTIDPLPLIKQRTGLDGRDKEIFIDYKSPMSLRIEVCLSALVESNGDLELCL